MSSKLTMKFLNGEGKNVDLSINDYIKCQIQDDGSAIPEMTRAQISALMDVVIANNSIYFESGRPVAKKSARYTYSDSYDYELE